ncbi:MAG: UvrD-helicase domain-containing protein, partial [Myxococcota bacterium]
MPWTPEQHAIIDHRLDAHAVVRAVPGAGKTTTLVGRVARLLERGVDPARVRVVMFNKAIQQAFVARLEAAGVTGVRVTTFDALGYEVLALAARRGLSQRRYAFVPDKESELARLVWRSRRDVFDAPEEIADAVAFWKAHLVPPARARFPSQPALVEAYAEWEEIRVERDVARITFQDMVYTAVGVLGRYPRLLGPIDHLLVDEFQDVNPGRVELVRRLAHDATAIMAVGDEDQGVNEWCGAHPRYFRDFAATFPWLPTERYTLSKSFRFGRVIAGAADRVIRNNTDRSEVTVKGGGAAPGIVKEIDDVAVAVKGLLGDGVAPVDIAVLYRGRTQGAQAIAALAAAGIPLRTDDADLL